MIRLGKEEDKLRIRKKDELISLNLSIMTLMALMIVFFGYAVQVSITMA